MSLPSLFTVSLLSLCSTCLALQHQRFHTRASYPFSQVVAFGDELSDNGNGSYAHGISGNPANIYGFGTWTNGPVAVSYLADSLGASLKDYAFGGSDGGMNFGATIDDSYTKSPANAPSVNDQIHDYTTSGDGNIGNSLAFIWIGQTDLSGTDQSGTHHTDAFWFGDPHNTQFATDISTKIADAVNTLINAGIQHVLVANIYPKHIAPVTRAFLCTPPTDYTTCSNTWGQVIQQANTAIENSLKPHVDKVLYYDAFGYLSNLAANAGKSVGNNGFTQPLQYYCDGGCTATPPDPNCKWDQCMVGSKMVAEGFFWMSYENPTTKVHQMLAQDMKNSVDVKWGGGKSRVRRY